MIINKQVLRTLVVSGLFFLLVIPLFVSISLFFPYITGKAFAFRIIVEVVLAAGAMLAILDAKYRPRFSPIVWAVVGLVAVSTLAAIFGASPYHSFWSNFERMEGLITYFHLLAYFLVLISVLKTEKLWRWFFHISITVSLIIGFNALSQWFANSGGGFRADATFGNPIYLAVYALIHFFLALFAAVRVTKRWPSIIYGAIALFEIFVIYFTATRSALLGLVGGVFAATLLVALFGREQKNWRRWAIGVVVAIVLVVGGFWLARDSAFIQSNPVLSRLANISLQDNTTRHRLIVWGIGWEGFKERPILGWGPENFNLVFNKYYNPQLYGAESWFDRSHNILIDWLVHAGVLGLLAYLSLFACAVYCLWRRTAWRVTEKSVLTGLLVAYFIHNLFVFDNLISYLLFFALLAYIHFVSSDNGQLAKKKIFSGWFVVPIVVALIFSLYYFNFKPISANRNLIQAISFSPQQVSSQEQLNEYVAQKEDLFKRVFAARTFASGEASEQLFSLTMQLIQIKQVTNVQKQAFVDLAGEQMLAQIARAPADARAALFFGNFLNNIGQTKDAIKYLNAARVLSPGKQQIIFEQVHAYWKLGDKKKALMLAQEAYDLNPDVADAKKILEQVSAK